MAVPGVKNTDTFLVSRGTTRCRAVESCPVQQNDFFLPIPRRLNTPIPLPCGIVPHNNSPIPRKSQSFPCPVIPHNDFTNLAPYKKIPSRFLGISCVYALNHSVNDTT